MKVNSEAVERQKALIRCDIRELLGEGAPPSPAYTTADAAAIYAGISARIECLEELGLLTRGEFESFTARARDGLDQHVALESSESKR